MHPNTSMLIGIDPAFLIIAKLPLGAVFFARFSSLDLHQMRKMKFG